MSALLHFSTLRPTGFACQHGGFAASQHASGLTKALARQHFSFFCSCFALQRTRCRCPQRSGKTPVASQRDDLLKR